MHIYSKILVSSFKKMVQKELSIIATLAFCFLKELKEILVMEIFRQLNKNIIKPKNVTLNSVKTLKVIQPIFNFTGLKL